MNPFAKLTGAEVERKCHIINWEKTTEKLRKIQCHAAKKYTVFPIGTIFTLLK